MHIFDIETGADVPRAMALLPEFDESDVAVGNLKDPQKIAAKIVNRRENHQKNWLEKAALLPETGMVLAIWNASLSRYRPNHYPYKPVF
jgi:hypothetical protein